MENIADGLEQPNSCGIKKIIDCKLSNDGRQFYKVKWEPTWEPAENLVTCQHLLDKFWSHVNNLKRKEDLAMQYQRKIKLELENLSNDYKGNLNHLSSDSKEDVQKLIARTSMTPVGLNELQAPSDILASLQFSPGKVFDPPKTKKNNTGNGFSPPKSANGGGKVTASGLKYLENFDNPYVKVIVVCKICNKEQSLKHTHHWKLHHQIHSNEKPYKCPHCPSAFKRSDYLRSHVQGKHSIEAQAKQQMKQEPF